jgi:hypothetical protein
MDPQPPNEPPAIPPPMPIAPAASRTNGLAVASLVLGILALVLFFTIVFPIILGILAVIFGAIGWAKANQGADHKGLAIAGLILGVMGIGAMILFVAVFATTTVEIINSYTPSISPMP